MEDFFIGHTLEFEKTSAEVTLPDDANAWPMEVLQELFKQVPYISDFEPHVMMDRVDAEKGFGFGHVEVANKSEAPRNIGPDAKGAAGIRQARIPIIIKSHKLQAFDILVTADSKMLPLTEARLRSAIFRPQLFDITSTTPGDQSMIGQLYPPYRQNYGFGGGGATQSAGMGKDGSVNPMKTLEAYKPILMNKHNGETEAVYVHPKHHDAKDFSQFHAVQVHHEPTKTTRNYAVHHDDMDALMGKEGHVKNKVASILELVLPTILEKDFNKFATALLDQDLQAAYVHNIYANDSLRTLAGYVPVSLQKTANVFPNVIKATVVQLAKNAEEEGYTLKTANHQMWAPISRQIDRGEAVQRFGTKIVLAADLAGGVTATEGTEVAEEEDTSPEADRPQTIKDYGVYKVTTEAGQELVGYVFPNLLDLDGQSVPLALFTNGSQAALQGEIVGVRAGEGLSLPAGPPKGHGCFYRVLPNGKAEATIPFDINGGISSAGETSMMATTFEGQQVQIMPAQPNIKNISTQGEQVLVPMDFQWLPLDQAGEVTLASTPDEVKKEGQARRQFASVTVRADGSNSYSISGLPVEKLASDETQFLPLNDALFLLGALGVEPAYGQAKLAEADHWSAPVQVRVGRMIKQAGDRWEEAWTQAEESLSRIPHLSQSLWKEAAAIPDPAAVDTVLSLGFLNGENITMFMGALPTIDMAQQKMCELLVAARLGLREVPTGALEKAIKSTEEVIEGLKVLAFQQN